MSDKNDTRSRARPFVGKGGWTDRPEFPKNYEQRLERLRNYMRSHKLSLPEGYDEVLALCNTAAELRFLIPIITLPMWNRVGPQSFGNGVYRITVRGFVGGDRVPILFEDSLNGREIVFEVGYRSEFMPGKINAQNRRRAEIRKKVFKYWVIPELQARRIASGLRADIARQQAQGIKARSSLATAQLTDPNRPRVWLPNELVYNVSDIPHADRLPILTSWLTAHQQAVTDAGISWLTFCDSAAELWFGLQMLAFGETKIEGTRLTIHGTVRVDVQAPLSGQKVDFYIDEWRTAFQFDRPSWYSFDFEADREDNKLRDIGYTVERVEAKRAISVGKVWHTRISNRIRNLPGQE